MSRSDFSTANINKLLNRQTAAENKEVEQSNTDIVEKSKVEIRDNNTIVNKSNNEAKLVVTPAVEHEENKVENPDEAFSYTKLNDHFQSSKKWILAGGYGAALLPKNPNFITLTYLGNRENKNEEGWILATVGLKFHISLPEPDNEKFELSKGWDIVNSVLRKHKADCKIIKRGVNMLDLPTQRGKIITVFATEDKSPKEWKSIFQELTEKLVTHNIPPGFRPPGTTEKPERILDGCHYVTYRFLDEEKRIPKLRGEQKLKILTLLDNDNQIKETDDPIKKLKISVNNQPEIPSWAEYEKTPTFRK